MIDPTMQEVFDKVVDHLRTQGEPAKNSRGKCKYKTDSGLKCAIGCLIEDDEYNPKMEGLSLIFSPANDNSGLFPSWMQREPINPLLNQLQRCHDFNGNDDSHWRDHLEEGFKDIAKYYQLTFTPRGVK